MINHAPVKATSSKASPLKVSPGRVSPGTQNFPGRARVQRAIHQTSEGAVQRVCAECDAKETLEENPEIQPKLEVGPANDRFEQEADQTAERVMRMADTELFKSQISPGNNQVQAKGAKGGAVPSKVANSIQGLRGGGSPLPKSSKAFFEPRFGQDFSKVRVHTDAKAADMAAAIQAKAFTFGNDIAFANGVYQPESNSGKQLLAHELTHTVQQIPTIARQGVLGQPKPRTVDPSVCYFVTVKGGMRVKVCPPSFKRAQEFNVLIRTLSKYQTEIAKIAAKYGVPEQILTSVIYVEQLDRIAFGDWFGKIMGKRKVSLGLAQVQVERAVELDSPKSRDFKKNPVTDAEFDKMVINLENSTLSIIFLAKEMQDNFNYYGKSPGKTVSDRWKFALAKHKGGHGPVGSAQVKAQNNNENHNDWAIVSKYMDSSITGFVNEVSEIEY